MHQSFYQGHSVEVIGRGMLKNGGLSNSLHRPRAHCSTRISIHDVSRPTHHVLINIFIFKLFGKTFDCLIQFV